jgi:hypothetical protein
MMEYDSARVGEAGSNFLGVDVHGLDVAAFLDAARHLYPVLALLWLAALLRIRRAEWLLAGVAAANAFAWLETNYPLQRIYAFGPSRDRVSNIALAQVVAAGSPALETWQVAQMHFEPFWGLLVAVISGWNVERVLRLYPWFSLIMMVAFAISLYFGMAEAGGQGKDEELPWERAFVAAFATLLCSMPFDFTRPYRVPWALTFLLKPNHALGLVLLPLVLGAFARIRTWRGRLATGLFLHLLGWVFVLHMVYVVAGLAVFTLLSRLRWRDEARQDAIDVAVVVGVNLLVVSPYLAMLLIGYPFIHPSPVMTIEAASPHLMEATFRHGFVFWLGLWGLVVLLRRGDRLSRLWAGQMLGAFGLWVGYYLQSALQLARERDEIYYWNAFLLAVAAGIGCWDLGRRAAAALSPRVMAPAVRAVAIGVLLVPFSLPYWWNPATMDVYFAPSIPPLPTYLREAGDFLRGETRPRDVLAGDPDFTRYGAALAGRRALLGNTLHFPKDYERRWQLQGMLVAGRDPDAVLAEAARYGVRYLVVTPSFLTTYYPASDLGRIGDLRHLRRVFFSADPSGDFVAIFRVEKRAS